MADGTGSAHGRRWGLRAVSIVVLAVFAVVAGVLFVATSRLAGDQERRLLNERAAEVGELLSSAVGTGFQSSLTSLATPAQQSPTGFAQAAKSQLASGAVAGIALVVRRGPDWVVQASIGKGLAAGLTLTGSRRSVVEASGARIHTDLVVVSPGVSRLAVALKSPVSAAGAVVYEEYVVDPSRPTRIAQSQPFHELNVALYVGSRPETARPLLGTTRDVPLRDRTSSRQVTVGDGLWLVIASARHPLAGSLASNLPKMLSITALLIDLAMPVLVQSVRRR